MFTLKKNKLHDRIRVCQVLIDERKYKSYLEIGCQSNTTFLKIICDKKIGVDPEKGGTHRMTSDQFFEQNTDRFDIVFIDGDHHHDQVTKDIENSLDVLNVGGCIVLHDCYPVNLVHEQLNGCGTVWRAFVKMREKRHDLDFVVLNYDHGVGVIRRGRQANNICVDATMEELTYKDLEQNVSEWLNLVKLDAFQDWLNGEWE